MITLLGVDERTLLEAAPPNEYDELETDELPMRPVVELMPFP